MNLRTIEERDRVNSLAAVVRHAPYGSGELLDALEELMGVVPIGDVDIVLDGRVSSRHVGDYASAYESIKTSENQGRAGRSPGSSGMMFNGVGLTFINRR